MDRFMPAIISTASEIISDLIEAISTETALYWSQPDGVIEDAANEATSRVHRLEQWLCSIPADVAALEPDYAPALALAHKRWLVCENCYADRQHQTECRLVDALLAGTRFDSVP